MYFFDAHCFGRVSLLFDLYFFVLFGVRFAVSNFQCGYDVASSAGRFGKVESQQQNRWIGSLRYRLDELGLIPRRRHRYFAFYMQRFVSSWHEIDPRLV